MTDPEAVPGLHGERAELARDRTAIAAVTCTAALVKTATSAAGLAAVLACGCALALISTARESAAIRLGCTAACLSLLAGAVLLLVV